MQDITVSALGESDMILYLVDASRALKEEEEAIAEILSKVKVPIIAVLNKSDILSIISMPKKS